MKLSKQSFCAKEMCVSDIIGNLHNIWHMQDFVEEHQHQAEKSYKKRLLSFNLSQYRIYHIIYTV